MKINIIVAGVYTGNLINKKNNKIKGRNIILKSKLGTS